MGSAASEEAEHRERVRAEARRFVKRFKKCPDVKVSEAIVMFCTSSSSDGLQQHLDSRKQEDHATAEWTKTLAEKLASLSPNPKLVGLGALALAVFIDVVSDTSPSEATKAALRLVFAEEKASEVWDQIDECLKRCIMHIHDDGALAGDITQMERQLSAALTRLKNSMVRDGHVGPRALKAWVNGAAFHIQMLIHLARLRGSQNCDAAERLLLAYISDLDALFNKHKDETRKKCRMGYDNLEDAPRPFFESETGEAYYVAEFGPFEEYFEAYYEEHYGRQRRDITGYFRRVTADLPELLHQEGRLSVM